MAGIAVDAHGRTSLSGLWACGEVTASGLHGANRLASNSLLEALVLGARAAESAASQTASPIAARSFGKGWIPATGCDFPELPAARQRQILRQLMWDKVGLVRQKKGLEEGLEKIAAMQGAGAGGELANLLLVGRLVSAAALAREESRGAHFREDFPRPRPALERRAFWTYDPRAEAGDFPLLASSQSRDHVRRKEIA
jgi:L-aspartate oxidase